MKVIKKSKNFDANLDAKRIERQILRNTDAVLEAAKEGANAIAPFDLGGLRDSATIHKTKNGGYIEWDVPYANKVYRTNNKNPQTTEWAKKDAEQNQGEYERIMTEGVIK